MFSIPKYLFPQVFFFFFFRKLLETMYSYSLYFSVIHVLSFINVYGVLLSYVLAFTNMYGVFPSYALAFTNVYSVFPSHMLAFINVCAVFPSYIHQHPFIDNLVTY